MNDNASHYVVCQFRTDSIHTVTWSFRAADSQEEAISRAEGGFTEKHFGAKYTRLVFEVPPSFREKTEAEQQDVITERLLSMLAAAKDAVK